MTKDFRYEIVREIGALSSFRYDGSLWHKEINVVSWNGHDPKFDIRDWSNDHSQMRKGITLSRDEIRALYKLLQNIIND